MKNLNNTEITAILSNNHIFDTFLFRYRATPDNHALFDEKIAYGDATCELWNGVKVYVIEYQFDDDSIEYVESLDLHQFGEIIDVETVK